MGAFWWVDRSILADQVRYLRIERGQEIRQINNTYGAAANLQKQLREPYP
jgi:hypothetical protein